jgi:adenylosuccinate synthase
MLNGVTHLYMMKADVLSDFDKVKVCIGYEYEGKEINFFPSIIDSDNIKPIYKSFSGWTSGVNSSRKYSDLEENFKSYISFIEDNVGVKVKLISLGPDRDETVLLD